MKAKLSLLDLPHVGEIHVSQIVERGAVSLVVASPHTLEKLRITLELDDARLLVAGLTTAIDEASA